MTGGAIIYLEDVTVDYDGFKALSHLNFFMDRRELRVVIGPNGAGKTTLLDVISGRVRPASGTKCTDSKAWSALARICVGPSSAMNHCGVARKMTGALLRQLCG